MTAGRRPLDPVVQALVGEPLLKVAEAAAVLNVHRSKVYRLVQEGALPAVHVGDSVRLRPADLRLLIEENTRVGRKRRPVDQVAEGTPQVTRRTKPRNGGWRPPTEN